MADFDCGLAIKVIWSALTESPFDKIVVRDIVSHTGFLMHVMVCGQARGGSVYVQLHPGEGVMASGYDDGVKNADVFDGIERPLSRFAPGFDPGDAYGDGHGRSGGERAPSLALIERTVEASVLTALLRRHGTLHPPATLRSPGHPPGEGLAPHAGKALPRGLTSLRGLTPSPSDMSRFVALIASGDVPGALAWLAPWRHHFGLLDDRMAVLLGEAAQRLGQG